MYTGKTLFAQLMDFLPWKTFHRIVARHDGDRRIRTLTCAEQFRVMAFAQLTYRKMHTLLDLRGNIPSFIHVSDDKLHDVHALDLVVPDDASHGLLKR